MPVRSVPFVANVRQCLPNQLHVNQKNPVDFSTTQTSNVYSLIADSCINAHPAAEITQPSNATVLMPQFNPLPELAPTPINITQLEFALSGYPPIRKRKLLSSLRRGFDIGFSRVRNFRHSQKISNLPLSTLNHLLTIFVQNCLPNALRVHILHPLFPTSEHPLSE